MKTKVFIEALKQAKKFCQKGKISAVQNGNNKDQWRNIFVEINDIFISFIAHNEEDNQRTTLFYHIPSDYGKINGHVNFTIEDPNYFIECLKISAKQPDIELSVDKLASKLIIKDEKSTTFLPIVIGTNKEIPSRLTEKRLACVSYDNFNAFCMMAGRCGEANKAYDFDHIKVEIFLTVTNITASNCKWLGTYTLNNRGLMLDADMLEIYLNKNLLAKLKQLFKNDNVTIVLTEKSIIFNAKSEGEGLHKIKNIVEREIVIDRKTLRFPDQEKIDQRVFKIEPEEIVNKGLFVENEISKMVKILNLKPNDVVEITFDSDQLHFRSEETKLQYIVEKYCDKNKFENSKFRYFAGDFTNTFVDVEDKCCSFTLSHQGKFLVSRKIRRGNYLKSIFTAIPTPSK